MTCRASWTSPGQRALPLRWRRALSGFRVRVQVDPEHGLGVLTHDTRVVEVGGADTAILLWIARRDAEANNLSR